LLQLILNSYNEIFDPETVIAPVHPQDTIGEVISSKLPVTIDVLFPVIAIFAIPLQNPLVTLTL
jgi:hypothetical protein